MAITAGNYRQLLNNTVATNTENGASVQNFADKSRDYPFFHISSGDTYTFDFNSMGYHLSLNLEDNSSRNISILEGYTFNYDLLSLCDGATLTNNGTFHVAHTHIEEGASLTANGAIVFKERNTISKNDLEFPGGMEVKRNRPHERGNPPRYREYYRNKMQVDGSLDLKSDPLIFHAKQMLEVAGNITGEINIKGGNLAVDPPYYADHNTHIENLITSMGDDGEIPYVYLALNMPHPERPVLTANNVDLHGSTKLYVNIEIYEPHHSFKDYTLIQANTLNIPQNVINNMTLPQGSDEASRARVDNNKLMLNFKLAVPPGGIAQVPFSMNHSDIVIGIEHLPPSLQSLLASAIEKQHAINTAQNAVGPDFVHLRFNSTQLSGAQLRHEGVPYDVLTLNHQQPLFKGLSVQAGYSFIKNKSRPDNSYNLSWLGVGFEQHIQAYGGNHKVGVKARQLFGSAKMLQESGLIINGHIPQKKYSFSTTVMQASYTFETKRTHLSFNVGFMPQLKRGHANISLSLAF